MFWLAFLTPLAALAQVSPPDLGAETCQERFDSYQDNLFRVDSGGAAGKGIAVFVGRQGNELWLAAPAHVVFVEDQGGGFLGGVVKPNMSVHSFKGRLMRSCGIAPTNWSGRHDLTFLCVMAEFDTFVHDEVLADLIDPRATFALIGSGDSLHTLAFGANLEEFSVADAYTGAEFRLRGVVVNPGDSGAVVGNCRGLVGVFLDSRGHVLSFNTIRDEAQETQVPWTLSRTEYFLPEGLVTFCPNFVRGAPQKLVLQSMTSDRSLEVENCSDLPHGNYQVKALDPAYDCAPKHLSLSTRSEALVEMKVNCVLQLSGTWESAEGGDLMCVGGAFGVAQCSGWTSLRRGLFSGQASNVGDNEVRFSGLFASPNSSTSAIGEFTWSDGALNGNLRFGDLERQLSLRRAP